MKGKSQPCQLKKMKLMKCHVRSLSSKKNLILCLCNNKWCIKVDRYVFISILMIGLKSKSIKTLTLIRLMSRCLVRLGGWHQKPPASILAQEPILAKNHVPVKNGNNSNSIDTLLESFFQESPKEW